MPLYEDIYMQLSIFEHVYFHHIYKEHNKIDDQLSKSSLQLVEGTCKVWEVKNDIIKELDPSPLIFSRARWIYISHATNFVHHDPCVV